MTRSRRRDKSAVRRCLEWLLLAAGVAGVGVWAGSQVIPRLWQAWQNREFERAKNAPPAPPSAGSAPRVKNGQVLGRFTIPRLGLSSMVREGDDETTLSLALGHIPGTALPGEKGNVGVAGHRDTIFRALRKIQKDDTIQFETLSGTHVYEVDSTRIVKPQDVAVLRPGRVPSLTLVTCYPFYYVGSAPERFIVSAHEVPAVRAQSVAPADKAAAEAAPVVRTVAFHAPPISRDGWFEIGKGGSKEVAPGVLLGVTDADARTGRVYGWILLKREQRTILLSGQPARKPVVFLEDGRRRELQFTRVMAYSVTGSVGQP